MKEKKTWLSPIPEKCDITGEPITTAFIDGRVKGIGSWGIMTPEAHEKYGCGLGTGRGQKYEKEGDKFVKVAG